MQAITATRAKAGAFGSQTPYHCVVSLICGVTVWCWLLQAGSPGVCMTTLLWRHYKEVFQLSAVGTVQARVIAWLCEAQFAC